MMDKNKPWASMDPNSQHQLWSRWVFKVWDCGRHPPYKEVLENMRKWLRKGFGSVGQALIEEFPNNWQITAMIEGVPAHDRAFVVSVRKQFQKSFVEPGWGCLAISNVKADVLAGETQNGRPPSQLIVMPSIILEDDAGN